VSAPTLKQVYVVAGGLGASGSVSIADVAPILVDVPLGTALFSDVAAGDLDHDNRPDLLISTSADVATHPAKYQDAGKVFVIYGAAAIPAPQPRLLYLPNIVKNG
jgi:hypothetical protein